MNIYRVSPLRTAAYHTFSLHHLQAHNTLHLASPSNHSRSSTYEPRIWISPFRVLLRANPFDLFIPYGVLPLLSVVDFDVIFVCSGTTTGTARTSSKADTGSRQKVCRCPHFGFSNLFWIDAACLDIIFFLLSWSFLDYPIRKPEGNISRTFGPTPQLYHVSCRSTSLQPPRPFSSFESTWVWPELRDTFRCSRTFPRPPVPSPVAGSSPASICPSCPRGQVRKLPGGLATAGWDPRHRCLWSCLLGR